MKMRTFDEYYKDLCAMKPNIWIGNEKVGRDDPRLKGGMRILRETFEKAHNPAFEEVCTATSHITGEKINRFTHIHQSADDLLKKQRMTRILCHRTGGCIQRCMGIDALNAVSVVTYECDQALGTSYHQNFLNYMKMFQKKDLAASCASTDAKGDRSKRPSQQENPDAYLRVVETREDGIIVRGAKQCITNTPYVDEIVAVPCRMMMPEDYEYAVSFAIPADTEGVKLLARPAYFHKPDITPAEALPRTIELGDAETFIVFDDVFVPNDRIFLNGQADKRQTPYAGFLALMFAHYHRHSYCGCKPAITEVLASASALVAEYNGIDHMNHAKEKISHMLGTAELVYAAGESSALHSERSPSGTQIPDEILTNAGRRHAGENIYDEYKTLADLAGGLMAALPFMDTFYNEEVGKLAMKYMQRNPKIPPEDVLKCFKGVENLGCSDFGALTQVAGLHGGGSPQMETIAMAGRYDMEKLKDIARYLFGINPDLDIIERSLNPVTPRKMLDKYKRAMLAQQKK
ncbi:MAG: aromatic ring hydroxylase [Candidatus Lokiarchaeota archaeon]|nr:aromatic ring hydroxylase [Candidatus Lokiarchaeota archaeon]